MVGEVVPDAVLAGVPEPVSVGDGVIVLVGDVLGVGVGDFRTATLRLMMVVLDTPASLASQEYVDRRAPLVNAPLGTSAVTLV